jgi:hypothetical protein
VPPLTSEPVCARPPGALAANPGRADSRPAAGATPEGGSPPARQAAGAQPRAAQAPTRPDARVSAAPDFASAVAGYRAWQLGPGGVLFPLALPAAPPWERGVNHARCFAAQRHDAHEPPHPDCMCGLHALHRPDDRRLEFGHPAVGAIAAWGEIEVYAGGFRAECGCVIALADQGSRSTAPPARLHEAARRYGVRVVPFGDLGNEASEFALALPDEVIPQLSTARRLLPAPASPAR